MNKRKRIASWEQAELNQEIIDKQEPKQEAKQSRLIQKQIRKETRELRLRERASKEQSYFVNPRISLTSIICLILLISATVLYRIERFSDLSILLIFGAIIIAGETLEIPLVRHSPVTLGIIAIPALARTTTKIGNGHYSLNDTILVIVLATIVSAFILRNANLNSRLLFIMNRLSIYIAGLFVYREVRTTLKYNNVNLYITVLISTASMIIINEIYNLLAKQFYSKENYYSFQVYAALISIFAGTTLLTIGYAGTAATIGSKTNELGINAFWICTIARFSFARYYRVVKNYKETIRALSSAPELGGIVPTGHASRVAHLAEAMARYMKLDEREIEAIETAAYLHTLGDAVLDVNFGDDEVTDEQAAQVTAKIVRRTGGLNRIAEIIENHSIPYRGVVNGKVVAQNDLAASVLRLANDYEVLSRREESLGKLALGELYSNSNQFTYHPEVVIALEKILDDPRNSYMADPLAFAYAESELVAIDV